MGFPNKQIGWSQEAILLHEIIKQLNAINKTLGTVAPAVVTPTTTTTTTV